MQKKSKWMLGAYVVSMTLMVVFLIFLHKQVPIMEKRLPLIQAEQQLQKEINGYEARIKQASAEIGEEQEKLKPYEQKIREAIAIQDTLRGRLDMYAGLYKLDFTCPIPNYDVKRFQAMEKSQGIGGKIGGILAGPLVGSLMKSSFRDNQDRAYQNRAYFTQTCIDQLQPAITGLSKARTAFDGAYEGYQRIADTQEDTRRLENLHVLGKLEGWQENLLQEERDELLYRLSAYRLRLQIFYDISHTILDDVDYLSEISEQLVRLQAILDQYDPQGDRGYKQQKKEEIIKEAMSTYQSAVDSIVGHYGYDPAVTGASRKTGYNVGYLSSNSNDKGRFLIMEDEYNLKSYFSTNGGRLMVVDGWGGCAWFYQGEMICHSYETDERANKVVEHCRWVYDNFDNDIEHQYRNHQLYP